MLCFDHIVAGRADSERLATIKQELPVVPRESYVRIDEYARGGLGRIIRAQDERTGRFVAVKEMLADSADAAARFVREAMVTAKPGSCDRRAMPALMDRLEQLCDELGDRLGQVGSRRGDYGIEGLPPVRQSVFVGSIRSN